MISNLNMKLRNWIVKLLRNLLLYVFHMSIPCDKNFPWVPLFFTMWPWPWSLTHFLKTLTLLITFEQWVLELWYFTWVFLVLRSFRRYHYFYTVTLTLEFDPFLKKTLTFANYFWTVSAWALLYHMSFSSDNTFP